VGTAGSRLFMDGERLPGLAIVSAGFELTCWWSPTVCAESVAQWQPSHTKSKPHPSLVAHRRVRLHLPDMGQFAAYVFPHHWLLVKSRFQENSGV
jgi:hypothetical protein